MSKLHKFFLVAWVVFAGSSSAAFAGEQMESDRNAYLALGAAYDSMPDRNLDINGNTVSSQWFSGWGVLAALGYKWGHGIRTEAEFSQRLAKVKAFNHTNPWTGNQWDNSLMINALYDVDLGWGLVPFLGGGIGASHISWGNNFRSPKGPTIYDAESTKFGWQGIVGVSYDFTQRWSAALDFRIKGSGSYTFPGSTAGKVINNFDYLTRTVFVSIRYAFD